MNYQKYEYSGWVVMRPDGRPVARTLSYGRNTAVKQFFKARQLEYKRDAFNDFYHRGYRVVKLVFTV